MIWILLFAMAGFVIYSVVTYWKTTPTDATKTHRLWLSITAAATALAGVISTWLHGGGPTTP
jgi:uncharacterized membrane protein YedE/YeeE